MKIFARRTEIVVEPLWTAGGFKVTIRTRGFRWITTHQFRTFDPEGDIAKIFLEGKDGSSQKEHG